MTEYRRDLSPKALSPIGFARSQGCLRRSRPNWPNPDRERVPGPASGRLMEIADLARWTPIRFDFSEPTPTVDWADLSAERFDEPFFDQTVARWATVQLPSHWSEPGSMFSLRWIASRRLTRRA